MLFKARPVELLFTFCPKLSNCQIECEVCCSDVNVIPNLSIVPKKLVMVTPIYGPGRGGGVGTAKYGLYKYMPLCAVKGMVFKQFTLG